MTLQEFIDKWLGSKADFDGFYGGQCVDLYRFYVKEVLNFPQSEGVGGAAEIWDTADPDYYDFIQNSPTAVPQYGDIVIWNRKVGGGFGHVAIFISGDVNSFVSLDQNWPTLDKVTKTQHSYTNVIGWLRPKKQADPVDPRIIELQKELDAKNIQIGNLQGQVNGLLEDNRKLSGDLGTANSEKQAMVIKIESLNTIIAAYNKEDAVQISDLKTAQNERKYYKDLLDMSLWDIEDELKLSHPSEDFDTRWSKVIQAVESLKNSKVKQLDISDYLLVVFGRVIWRKS